MNTLWKVALKDLRLEGRSKDIFSNVSFFSALVMLILGFALGNHSSVLSLAGPGILWTAIAFSSVLAAGRSWNREAESEALEQLMLYPTHRSHVYLGKMLANFILMSILAAIASPISWIIYPFFSPAGPLDIVYFFLTVLLGVLGFSIVSTFYAALTVTLRAKEALLPILMFPVVVPVVLGAVNAISLISGHAEPQAFLSWMALLLVFDIVYGLVASFAFPYMTDL